MSFTKRTIVDRSDNNPDQYLVDGTASQITKDDTGLITQGTAVNAELLQRYEDGIDGAYNEAFETITGTARTINTSVNIESAYTNTIELKANTINFVGSNSGELLSTGKNIFDGELESGVLSLVTGLPLDNNDWYRSKNFTPIDSSKTYTRTTGLTSDVFLYYDSNFNFLSNDTDFSNIPINTFYLKFYYRKSSGITNVQIEEGSTPTTFEEYNSTSISYTEIGNSLPNNVADRLYTNVSGQWRKEQNINDGVAVTSGTAINTTNYPLASSGGQFRIVLDAGGEQIGTINTDSASGDGTLYYQLAASVTTEVSNIGNLILHPSGTITTTTTTTLPTVTISQPTNPQGQTQTNSQSTHQLREDFRDFNHDYEYQTPTIVSQQIQLTKRFDSSILKFRLTNELSGGNITISLDGGTTSKNLQDVDGNNIDSLDAGFVEVIEDTTFFTLRPRGAAINGIIEQYEIDSGSDSISAGDFVRWINGQKFDENNVLFNSGSSNSISSALVDTDKVLIVYRDDNNSGFGTAAILTINDINISVGSSFVFNSASVQFLSMVLIETNKTLVAYRDDGDSGFGNAVVLSVSGETITAGTEFTFNSGAVRFVSSTVVDTNKVLVAYRDDGNSNVGTSIVLTVSGTTISAGTEFTFNNAATSDISVVSIDTDKAIAAYSEGTNGLAIVLSVSGTTISAGTELEFSTSRIQTVSSTFVETNKAFFAYDISNGAAIVLTVSGTTITAGTEFIFNSGTSFQTSSLLIDTNKVLVTYENSANSSFGEAIIFNISGTTLEILEFSRTIYEFNVATGPSSVKISDGKNLLLFGSTTNGVATLVDDNLNILYGLNNIEKAGLLISGNASVFNSGTTGQISSVLVDTNKVLITYIDAGNGSQGTAIIADISGNNVTFGSETVFVTSFLTSIDVAQIDINKAVLVYTTSSQARCLVLTVSGTTINAGSSSIVNNNSTDGISVLNLEQDKAITAYADNANSGFGTARVLTITNTSISLGSNFVFNNAVTASITNVLLEPNKVLTSFANGNTNGLSRVLTVSGTTISAGTAFTFNSGATQSIWSAFIDTDKVIVVYRDAANSNQGTSIILSVSGTTITGGSEFVFNNDSTNELSVIQLDTNKALVSYQDTNNSAFGIANMLNVNNTTITNVEEIVFNSESTSHTFLNVIDLNKFLVLYRNVGNSNYGTLNIITDVGGCFDGVSRQNGNAGDTVQVYTIGEE